MFQNVAQNISWSHDPNSIAWKPWEAVPPEEATSSPKNEPNFHPNEKHDNARKHPAQKPMKTGGEDAFYDEVVGAPEPPPEVNVKPTTEAPSGLKSMWQMSKDEFDELVLKKLSKHPVP